METSESKNLRELMKTSESKGKMMNLGRETNNHSLVHIRVLPPVQLEDRFNHLLYYSPLIYFTKEEGKDAHTRTRARAHRAGGRERELKERN